MPNTKVYRFTYPDIGSTLKAILTRQDDNFQLDSSDGIFKLSPISNLNSVTEVVPYVYSFLSSASVWSNGLYDLYFKEGTDIVYSDTLNVSNDNLVSILNVVIGGGILQGLYSVDITVEVGSLPAVNVILIIYNASETVVLGQAITDTEGLASFSADDGTYKIKLHKAGFYMPTNPVETLVVDGAAETATYEMEALTIPVSAAPDVCRVYEYMYIPNTNTPVDEKLAIATLQVTSAPYANQTYDATFERDEDDIFTGLVYWDIAYGATVRVYMPYVFGNKEKIFVVPSETTSRILDN